FEHPTRTRLPIAIAFDVVDTLRPAEEMICAVLKSEEREDLFARCELGDAEIDLFALLGLSAGEPKIQTHPRFDLAVMHAEDFELEMGFELEGAASRHASIVLSRDPPLHDQIGAIDEIVEAQRFEDGSVCFGGMARIMSERSEDERAETKTEREDLS